MGGALRDAAESSRDVNSELNNAMTFLVAFDEKFGDTMVGRY